MRIIITGSPGTGKSTISRKLASALGLRLIDIALIARSAGLVGKTQEVDIPKLSRRLAFLKGLGDYLAEGHLACETRLPADHVIVLRCRPDVLRKRLARRGYGKSKVEENVLAEALDYCSQRAAILYGKKPIELETAGRSVPECADILSKAIRNKKKALDSVDYSAYLMRIAVKR